MGGKGKKRREKNYKEAHGVGKNRLPPPPVRSSLDVIPAKLRKTHWHSSNSWSGKLQVDGEEIKRVLGGRGGNLIENDRTDKNKDHLSMFGRTFRSLKEAEKHSTKDKSDSVASGSKMEDDNDQYMDTEKKKKKRKRKRLLEERKKKHKKVKVEDGLNFPGCEEIKFGEVVQAPRNGQCSQGLITWRFGSSINASQERIRLRTIEAYREQKKWASRPGLHLPTTDITPPSL
ncbi:hypothetical protein OSB04_011075 [Centaurea solstitialis]|uniref:Uncharacterized protein n=1 Tax=Centaurea solstitialis TaxID=347529 RepID=A0AA38WPT9_9ASTR|nr:hypothetical protein OSB04_011075 [Centaurea solstitialis]